MLGSRRRESVEEPQPRWAGGRVIGHAGRTGASAELRLEEMPLGYGTEFKRYEGRSFNAGAPDLPVQPFSRCTFIRCNFRGGIDVQFRYSRLVDCNFLTARDDGKPEAQCLTFEWCELRGGVGGGVNDDRSNGVFSRVHLSGLRFDNCFLDRMKFGAVVTFERARFWRTQGLPTCTGLEHIEVSSAGARELNRDLEDVPVSPLDRYASWEGLRTVGSLPLFGTSLAVLVAIPTVFFAIALYNEQLRAVQGRVADIGSEPPRTAQEPMPEIGTEPLLAAQASVRQIDNGQLRALQERVAQAGLGREAVAVGQ